ncbi:MAG: CHAP domain-containing protein [Oscillospiraceae bacterium]
MKKRVMCLFLTLMFAVTLVPMTASAAGNPYPTTQNVDGDAYYEVPCTWFAWQSVYDNQGVAMPGWGNAGNWLNGARNSGYATGSTPAVGAVAVWQGNGYGHVAYVVSVQSTTTFTVNEGGRTDLDQTNSHGVAYSYKITNAVGGKRPYDNGLTLVGFIYPKGKSSLQCTWETPSATKITQTNAFLYGKLNYNQNANCTQCGVRLINASTGASVASKDEYVNYNSNYVDMWYDITDELGVTLTPGTTYKYNFYAIINGKEYWSPVGTFTTEGHTHRYTSTVTNPTCTAQGYTTHTCSCGDWYRDNFTNALGHSYGAWEQNKAPTCTAQGTEKRTCTRCNATQTRNVAELGHNYSNGKCTRCGAADPKYVSAPTLKITTVSGHPKIYWNSVSGATKYWIYRSTDGKNFKYYDSTTKTSYTNNATTIGKLYYYKVKAVKVVDGTNKASGYSNTKSIRCKPAAPSLSIARTNGKPQIYWNCIDSATKYWIYRSTDGVNFSYYDSTTKTSYTNKSTTKGKTYYYKVKAVKVVNGSNIASAYSNTKSLKVSK